MQALLARMQAKEAVFAVPVHQESWALGSSKRKKKKFETGVRFHREEGCWSSHNAFQTYSLLWLDQGWFWADSFPKHQQKTTLNMLQGLNRERKTNPKDSQIPSGHNIPLELSPLKYNTFKHKSLLLSFPHSLFCSFLLLVDLLYITFSKSCMDLIIFSSWWEKEKLLDLVHVFDHTEAA